MGRGKKKLPNELSDLFELTELEIKKLQELPLQKDSSESKMAYAFVAPELVETGIPADVSGFESKPSWDVAVRFQDLKKLGHISDKEKMKLKKRAIEGVLERAHSILGPVLRPEYSRVVDYRTFLESGGRGELDVLETVDENFSRGVFDMSQAREESLRFDARVEKSVDIAVVMDASLSMRGEKIALLAVSAAVVALCVPSLRLALMGFDSKVRWVKHFGEELTIESVVERVLELPAGGFTNMEIALQEISKTLHIQRRPKTNVILISDGKYTEGGDPLYLASRFQGLSVLKIGKDQAGRDLLQDLSSRGDGNFFEARKVEDLPKTMYGAMKTLLR